MNFGPTFYTNVDNDLKKELDRAYAIYYRRVSKIFTSHGYDVEGLCMDITIACINDEGEEID